MSRGIAGKSCDREFVTSNAHYLSGRTKAEYQAIPYLPPAPDDRGKKRRRLFGQVVSFQQAISRFGSRENQGSATSDRQGHHIS
jgi:hypothetical protein